MAKKCGTGCSSQTNRDKNFDGGATALKWSGHSGDGNGVVRNGRVPRMKRRSLNADAMGTQPSRRLLYEIKLEVAHFGGNSRFQIRAGRITILGWDLEFEDWRSHPRSWRCIIDGGSDRHTVGSRQDAVAEKKSAAFLQLSNRSIPSRRRREVNGPFCQWLTVQSHGTTDFHRLGNGRSFSSTL